MSAKRRNLVILSASFIIVLSPLLTQALNPAAYQKYINQINAKAATVTLKSRRVLPVTYSGTCPVLPSNLSFGMRGTDVKALQTFLVLRGALAAGSATEYFGSLTQRAVQKFQKDHLVVNSGTPQTTGYGAVGRKTRAAIVATCSSAPTATTSLPLPASSSSKSSNIAPLLRLPASSSSKSSYIAPSSGGGGGSIVTIVTTSLCTASATQSCKTGNGTGTQTCNSSGSAWGICGSITSCNSGYYLQSGACVATVTLPSSSSTVPCTIGTATIDNCTL